MVNMVNMVIQNMQYPHANKIHNFLACDDTIKTIYIKCRGAAIRQMKYLVLNTL